MVAFVKKRKIVILGAGGRDFHNFNEFYRNNAEYEVVAFTATQIPGIEKRLYPRELAGRLYPKGIPIHDEKELPKLIKEFDVDEVVFAYSDVSHEHVMHLASIALANGASFVFLGPKATMVKPRKPLVSICATRTGSGKSPTTRRVCNILMKHGKRVVAIRHPMAYGNLRKQGVQRFAKYEDFAKHACTIEEREEYEPLVEKGVVVFAGVDYEKILRAAEKEADIVVWDGGNNDFPFYAPCLQIVVADPLRVGHELRYHPGETNLRMADAIVINKVDSASKRAVRELEENIKKANPRARIIKAVSKIFVEDAAALKGKRVIVVEDGPTLTHGEMSFGAGFLAAKKAGARIVDAKKHAVGSIKEVYCKYSQLEKSKILPALGYSKKQLCELEKTIDAAHADAVICATPVNLKGILHVNKPVARVRYEIMEEGNALEKLLKEYKLI